MNVNDQVAVVTGGASGIGLALCTRFAREGAHLVLSDLDQQACTWHAAPIGALPIAADVGREEDINNLVAATIEHFGRIDLFVSNAGIAIDGGIDTPTDKWHKIIDVNLGRLTSQAAQKPPPPVQSAGRVGSRLGRVSELVDELLDKIEL